MKIKSSTNHLIDGNGDLWQEADVLIVHYHTMITLVLQRRFLRLVVLSFIMIYGLVYIFFGSNWCWDLFIWSSTLPKSIFIFMPLFFVLVLKKAYMTLSWTTYSTVPFFNIFGRIIQPAMMHTFAVFLCVTLTCAYSYANFSSARGRYAIFTYSKHEALQVNEHLIYFYFNAVVGAFITTLFYYFQNYTKLCVPKCVGSDKDRWRASLHRLPIIPFILTTVTLPVSIVIYLLFRHSIFSLTKKVFRFLYNIQDPTYMSLLPFTTRILLDTAKYIFFTTFSIQIVITLFDLFMTKIPISQGRPLSQHSSTPNSTLITGLKAYLKPLTMALAYEELLFIIHHIPDRRQTIFRENSGQPWREICAICLECISETLNRHSTKPKNLPISNSSTQDCNIGNLITAADKSFAIPVKMRNENILVNSSQSL